MKILTRIYSPNGVLIFEDYDSPKQYFQITNGTTKIDMNQYLYELKGAGVIATNEIYKFKFSYIEDNIYKPTINKLLTVPSEININMPYNKDILYYIACHNGNEYELVNARAGKDNSTDIKFPIPFKKKNIGDEIILYKKKYIDQVRDNVVLTSNERPGIVDLSNKGRYNDRSSYNSSTSWMSITDLISGSNSVSAEQLIENLSYNNNVERLSIDFTEFKNYCYFGSALSKFENAVVKIYNILSYDDVLNNTYTGSADNSGSASTIETYRARRNEIITTMTQYEKAVYEDSGSYAWPKTWNSGSGEFDLISYSGSEVTSWISTTTSDAIDFDNNNGMSIQNMVPLGVKESPGSEYNFIPLMNAWGDFFDMIKLYIEHINYIYTYDYDYTFSASRDILYMFSDFFGWKLYEGYDLHDFQSYIIKTSRDGGYPTALRDITTEKWSRLLSSIAYLNSVRGTRRSIDALLNIYGIPSSLITVQEYGGNGTNMSYIDDEQSLYVLGFSGSGQIITADDAWGELADDFTIEGQWSSNTGNKNETTLFGNAGMYVSISGSAESGEFGKPAVYINDVQVLATSGSYPVFDNEWYTIALQVSGSDLNLFFDQYIDEELLYSEVATYTLTGTELPYLPGGGFASSDFAIGDTSFTGSIREFKIWDIAITENEIIHHTYNYESVALSDPSLIETNLIAHYKMNDNVDLSVIPTINDYSVKLPKYDADAVDFEANDFININSFKRTLFDQILGGDDANSNKISIGYSSGSQSADYNDVDVVFSPTKVINKDIMNDLAYLDFNNVIGNPADKYKTTYPELNKWRAFYFRNFPNNKNFNAYIKYIRNFDRAVWKILQQTMPYRANLTIGIMIEPTILERPKMAWERVHGDNLSFAGSITDIFTINSLYPQLYTESPNAVSMFNTRDIPHISGSYSYFESNGVSPLRETLTSRVQQIYAEPPAYGPLYQTIRDQISGATVGTINSDAVDYDRDAVIVTSSSGATITVK